MGGGESSHRVGPAGPQSALGAAVGLQSGITPKPDAGAVGASLYIIAGYVREEAGERDAPFKPCEGQADADMWATREGQMAVGFASDVKDIRVGELVGVAVGRTDAEVQVGTPWDENAIYFSTLRGLSIAELIGGGQTQNLFDGRID